ncbi:MAG: hypothetical protein AB1564_14510 [Chloroflexota bacterium]
MTDPDKTLALAFRQVLIMALGALEDWMIAKHWLERRSIVPRRERPPDWKIEYI